MRILSSILFCICFVYVMRYNLHMFQLNGYKNDEHFVWLKKNIKRQGALFLIIVALLLNFIKNDFWVFLVNFAVAMICIKYYMFLKKVNNKKKLVYTARMKRMIVCDILLAVLGIVVILCIDYLSGYGIYVIMLMVLLQPILVIAVNILNFPIEEVIKKHYINDAKKILRSNQNLVVIGVTGSYGKTSLKFYLESLLKDRFNVLVTPGSYNTPMGVVKTIRESLKSMHEIFICEMGARRVGEISEICDIVNPTHGVITAVTTAFRNISINRQYSGYKI